MLSQDNYRPKFRYGSMTTGSREFNGRTVGSVPPSGAALMGTKKSTSWSGGDAITALKKRASFADIPRLTRSADVISRDARLLGKAARRLPPYLKKMATDRYESAWSSFGKQRQVEIEQHFLALGYNQGVRQRANQVRDARKAARRKIKALPPQNYWKSVTQDTNRLYLSHSIPQNKKVWSSALSLPLCWAPTMGSYDQEEYQKLLVKVRRKAYGSAWNPAVAGVEANKSINMIFDASSQLYGALGALVRRDWRGVFRNLRSLYQLPPKEQERLKEIIKNRLAPNDQIKNRINGTDYGRRRKAFGWDKKTGSAYVGSREGIFTVSTAWLALQHGWIPLVNDVIEGARYFAMISTLNEPGPHQMLVASRSYERKYFGSAGLYNNGTPAGYTVIRDEVRMRVRIYRFKRSNPALPSLATVASAAWEAAPLSWIMDYAVQVQNYLEAVRTVGDVTGTVVFSVKTQRTYSGIAANKDYIYYGHVQGMSDKSAMHFQRLVSSALPEPSLVVSDGRKGVFSRWERTMNILSALGRGSFNGVSSRLGKAGLGDKRLSKPTF